MRQIPDTDTGLNLRYAGCFPDGSLFERVLCSRELKGFLNVDRRRAERVEEATTAFLRAKLLGSFTCVFVRTDLGRIRRLGISNKVFELQLLPQRAPAVLLNVALFAAVITKMHLLRFPRALVWLQRG